MTDWAKLKVVDLKAELKSRDLSQNGLKAELVARLENADQQQAGEQAAEDQEAEATRPEEGESAEAVPVVIGKVEDDKVPAAVSNEPAFEVVQDATVLDKAAESTLEVQAPPAEPMPEPASLPQPTTESIPQPGPVSESIPQAEPGHPQAEEKPSSPKPESKTENDEMAIDAPVSEPVPQAEPEQPQAEAKPSSPVPESKIDNDEMAIDTPSELQQRKKRSLSPPPDAEGVAKRARLDKTNDIAPAVHMADAPPMDQAEDEQMEDEKDPTVAPVEPTATQPSGNFQDDTDYGRSVAPAIHQATSALYIANLMRPLRPADIQTHLVELATPRGQPLNNDIITLFHLDQIRTHAFVVFTSTEAASRVRALLHDTVWPNESNRKALWLDFVPQGKVQGWIDSETGERGGRSSTRWEVVYADAPGGGVEARLEAATGAISRAGPPPPSAPTGPRADNMSVNNIPMGPRNQQWEPPTGPRAKRTGPGPRSGVGGYGDEKWTTAGPSISYTIAPPDLVERRLANMRSHYTDRRGPYGREINRYSFEQGDAFVDRGKEVFEGIRPPHRERGGRGGRGGGFGGGFGGGRGRRPRPRSDRYQPSVGGNFRYDDRS